MTDTVDSLMNQDGIKQSINSLCEDVENFEQIEFIYLLWATKEKELVEHGVYGKLETILGNLEKSRIYLLLESIESDVGE